MRSAAPPRRTRREPIVRAAGLALAVSLLLGATGGCATPEGTEVDFGTRTLAVAAKGTLQGAKLGRDLTEILFRRLPELVLWKIPRAILVEGPREIRLALASKETRVAILVRRVEHGPTPESVRHAVERLRETTGLPFEDGATWLAWWEEAQGLDAGYWLPAFVDAQIRDLDDEDYLVRDAADARLRAVSGRDVGYDAKASEEERAEGRAKWVEWRQAQFE